MPKSYRPFVRMSTAAMRSANRMGWAMGSNCTAVPIRIVLVRCEAAANNISGQGEWE